jgi:glutamate racemase
LEIACPALVPLVEAGEIASHAAFEACQNYLAPLLDFGADTVVLGCTHYPLLLETLQTLAPRVRFIDPAQTLAQDIATQLGLVEARTTNDVFYVSGERNGFSEWTAQLLQISAPKIETGPIFDL